MVGIKPYEYYCLTEYEYMTICKGYQMKQAEQSQHFRYLTWAVIAMNSEKGKAPKMRDLWPIPLIDGEEKEQEPVSKVDFERMVKKYSK